MSVDDLRAHAAQAGLDAQAFAACLDGGEAAAAVEAQMTGGRELGIEGVPAFFVNGILISGAAPIEHFRERIDAELERAR